ncbi:MAG: hypothetical protein KBF12_11940 [Sebaldella sp.]|nr:hypothetical protein [Sebaldella sp.]
MKYNIVIGTQIGFYTENYKLLEEYLMINTEGMGLNYNYNKEKLEKVLNGKSEFEELSNEIIEVEIGYKKTKLRYIADETFGRVEPMVDCTGEILSNREEDFDTIEFYELTKSSWNDYLDIRRIKNFRKIRLEENNILEIEKIIDIIDTIAVMFSTEKMELIYQNYNMIEKQTIIDNIKKNKEEYRNKYENWISFLKKDRDYLFEKGLLNHGKEEVKELGIFYDIYLK